MTRIRRWNVEVRGYGSGEYLATTQGKALADAWRSDVFSHLNFGDFLKVARCRLHWQQPTHQEITVSGRAAYFIDRNSQYVRFQYPDDDRVLSSHPLDVLPEKYRPAHYQSGSDKGEVM